LAPPPAAPAARWSSITSARLHTSTPADTSLAPGLTRHRWPIFEAYKAPHGLETSPWYSSAENDFNDDFGLTTDEGETFGAKCLPFAMARTSFTPTSPTDRALEAIASKLLRCSIGPFLGRQGGMGGLGRLAGPSQHPTYGGAATTNINKFSHELGCR